MEGCGYSYLVHIKSEEGNRKISDFFVSGCFHHGTVFVQKLGLDKRSEG
jgi:hypothetical protein